MKLKQLFYGLMMMMMIDIQRVYGFLGGIEELFDGLDRNLDKLGEKVTREAERGNENSHKARDSALEFMERSRNTIETSRNEGFDSARVKREEGEQKFEQLDKFGDEVINSMYT